MNSFNDIDYWLKKIKTNSSPDVRIFLIGNKRGLEDKRVISEEQGIKLKEDFEFDLFMEVCTKTGYNIQNLYFQACKILYDDYIDLRSGKRKRKSLKFGKSLKFDKLNKYLNF